MVIGVGQCGNRIADEFARLGVKSRHERSSNVITGTFAVDSDAPALHGLQIIDAHRGHRINIGESRTRGHGAGGLHEVGVQIAGDDGYKVVDSLRQVRRFADTDAFMLVAGAAGGTGSGAVSVLVQAVRERYADRPIYALIVLPFEHEEALEPRIAYNTALCLKAVSSVADAVFLVDNQRYTTRGHSLAQNIFRTNRLIVDSFFSLLCAGEETRRKRIGISVLDAGDIIQSLVGWSVLGYGKADLPLITLPWDEVKNRGNQAMDNALSDLSLQCDTSQSDRALYLVSAPEKEMNMDLVKHLGERVRNMAPEATIRYGDYPVNKGLVDITVIFSALKEVAKIDGYYESFRRNAESIRKKEAIPPRMMTATGTAASEIPPAE